MEAVLVRPLAVPLLPLAAGLGGLVILGPVVGAPMVPLATLAGAPAFTLPGLVVLHLAGGRPGEVVDLLGAVASVVGALGRVAFALVPVVLLFAANGMAAVVGQVAVVVLGILGLIVGGRRVAPIVGTPLASVWVLATTIVGITLSWGAR